MISFLYSALGFVAGIVVARLIPFQSPRQPELAIAPGERERDQLQQQLHELQQQCLRLRDELHQQKTQVTADCQDATFESLQSLLTNYPSAAQMAQVKPDLPARNLLALLTPLDNLLQSWGIEPIGIPWEAVPYDPYIHQADADDITPGEVIYIRFVGYRQGDRLLCPARVSRTLPPGVSP